MMNDFQLIDRFEDPGEGDFALYRRGRTYEIRFRGRILMSSGHTGSEASMANLCLDFAGNVESPRILVGGLGMGYSLRALLDELPPGARVVAAEIFPAVLEWNRSRLGHLAGRPLEDPRVTARVVDVFELLRQPGDPFHAILLDVDNGPGALSLDRNRRLYEREGLVLIRSRLLPPGGLIVWSADPSPSFKENLKGAGFRVEEHSFPVGTRSYTLYRASKT